MYLFKNNISLGLDISDFKIRLIQMRSAGKKNKIISFGEISLAAGIISDGIVQNKNLLSEMLNRLKKEFIGYPLMTKQIIAGLPEKQSFIKIIESRKAAATASDIEHEISKHFPCPLDELNYDYQKLIQAPIGNGPALHVAAIKKNIVNDYLEIFANAGFEAEVAELETSAIARCLLPQKVFSSQSVSIIIDIGTARTTIFIVCQNMVIFSISFDSIIHQAKAYLSDLLINLNSVLGFYQRHLMAKNLLLDAIYTCGSGAYFENLNSEIEKQTGLRSIIGNPWQNISMPLNYIAKKIKYPLAYTTAIGLALRPALNKKYI